MRAHNKGVMDEINITPLTDIFLVLLIIMMVVAPMLNYLALPV
ncbi:MAG: biopolymer transporter ExbD, partial [Candidatus Hydrogenedentes bacterium]|nr:biopolymer transporter ExbD [Candidatus Hydrogenedentota bacterium]